MTYITSGTPYFTTKYMAIKYYKPYGFDDINQAIKDKINAKEIFIKQQPPCKKGQRVFLNAKEGRFYIKSKG